MGELDRDLNWCKRAGHIKAALVIGIIAYQKQWISAVCCFLSADS